LKLDPESVQFTIVSDNLNGSQVWSQIETASVFQDYTISSNNENVIALEMIIDHLTRTLRSIKGGSEVSMRLIKKSEQPFLSFTIKTQVSSFALLLLSFFSSLAHFLLSLSLVLQRPLLASPSLCCRRCLCASSPPTKSTVSGSLP